MKKVFLTFGDGGQAFVDARERIAAEAARSGEFDEVLAYDWSDCSSEARSSILRRYKRGCGYWVWKPDVIYKVLQSLNWGDALVWSDAGNVVCRSRQWQRFWKMLESCDVIIRRITSCQMQFVRRELLDFFAPRFLKEERSKHLRMCFSFESGTIVFRKTQFTMDLVREWREIMLKHPELVKDVGQDDAICQLPVFNENRHDQAVLTMLVYETKIQQGMYDKIKSVWEFHAGLFPFGDPAICVVRNRSGNKFRLSFRDRMIRFFYRLLWRMQLLAEKHNCLLCWGRV